MAPTPRVVNDAASEGAPLEMRPAHAPQPAEPPGSTTSFFAIPAARAPTAPVDRAAGVRPPEPSARPAVPVGPPEPPRPVPGGISGPVANRAEPVVAVTGPRAPETRSQSVRAYAVVGSILVLALIAMVATAGLTLLSVWLVRQPVDADVTGVQPPPDPVAPPVPVPDAVVVPLPSPVASPRPADPQPPRPAQPQPTPRPTGARAVTVTVAGDAPYTSVEISCPSGFRERGALAGGVAVVAGVPREADCDIRFKGAAPAQVPLGDSDAKICDFPSEGNPICR